MAIETESRRVIVMEADDRDVKRAQQAFDRRAAASAKKQDDHLAQFLAAQGNLTKETLATARAAQALLDKEKEAAKAADLIGLSMDKVKAKTGTVGRGIDEMRKKFGEVGKQLGGMAAGFGIGLGVGAVTGIVEKLFAPPTPEQMNRYIDSLRNTEGLMGNIARQAAVYRAHMEAAAKQDAALAAKFKAADAIEMRYSAAARERALTGELKALDAARLTPDEEARARSDIFEKYRKLADEAEGAAKETRALTTAIAAARRKVPAGFGGFLSPWEGQPDLAADIAASERTPMAGFDAMVGKSRRGGIQLSGGSGDYAQRGYEKQLAENRALVKSFDVLGEAGLSAYEMIASGQVKFGEAVKRSTSGAMLALGKEALGRAAWNVAEGWAKWPLGNNHFIAAAKFAGAAAVLGAGAYALNTGGGGGAAAGASSAGAGGGGRSSGGEGTSSTIVVLSDSYMGADDETKRRAAERMVQAGTKRNRAVRMG